MRAVPELHHPGPLTISSGPVNSAPMMLSDGCTTHPTTTVNQSTHHSTGHSHSYQTHSLLHWYVYYTLRVIAWIGGWA